MKYENNTVKDIKIAYIGGGSRGWAWGLMSDLAVAEDISGMVELYDIDFEAAKRNEIIGNKLCGLKGCKSKWEYKAVESLEQALIGANFVIISIQPATFDEMHTDVHTPEKYEIYQSVGDTTGPGGIIRALRTIPMYEVIGRAIRDYSPNAWVINYTNPMAVCVNTLYRVFPKIKAFGCCHEVFGTQKFLAKVLDRELNIKNIKRQEIKTNVIGVNHFTWFTSAKYNDINIFPLYRQFCDKYAKIGFDDGGDDNWMNSTFLSAEMVKMDLFEKFGFIAAAGDRHLAEFCPHSWYLNSPEQVKSMKFGLTTVDSRKEDLKKRLARSDRLVSGEEIFEFKETGEDGVNQIRALLGIENLITNVNVPNVGQIPNLPIGTVVETNAVFSLDNVAPVYAGNIPNEIFPMISRLAGEQTLTVEAGLEKNLKLAFNAFVSDPLVDLPISDAKCLFDEMIDNTKAYLKEYGV